MEGGKWIDGYFSSSQYLRPGWHDFLGGFCLWALILSDKNLISDDQSEFQIKKIHQQCGQNITPNPKLHHKLYIPWQTRWTYKTYCHL
jgi:hypothetical protein